MAIDRIEDLPAAGGAYLLAMEVLRPIYPPVPPRRAGDLMAGRYVYAGSAKGPGGLRARIGRHGRIGKTPRWHIDHLTNATGLQAAAAFIDDDEHALLAALLSLTGITVPIPGFGSSDCRRCPAHLVALPDDMAPRDVFAAVSRAVKLDPVVWHAPAVVCFWRPKEP